MLKSSDPWSIVVIVLTVALFVLALFVKGFTKGLLVECAVLLVSIKLILMAKKTAVTEENLERRLGDEGARLGLKRRRVCAGCFTRRRSRRSLRR